jgi:signal transduction histidine kinase
LNKERDIFCEGIEPQEVFDSNMGTIINPVIRCVIKKENALFCHEDDRSDLAKTLNKQELIYNCLAVQAKIQDKVVGHVFLANSNRSFSSEDVVTIEKLCSILALAIYRRQAEEEIIQAKDKAEESEKLKTTFLSNISHEIRTPLNGIIGFANLITNQDLSEEKRQIYMEIISSNSAQLLKIINDLLDISHIETGKISISLNPVSVNTILRDLQEEFLLTLKRSKKSNLSLMFFDGLTDHESYILSDEMRIKQILSNLLSNAIKFTKKGEISYGYVYIEDIQKLRFFVKDTGIGINHEYQKIIFDSFRQEDESKTRKYGGSGVGLSITKALVEKLGGEIWFDSKKGEGTTFYFTIPYKPLLVRN